MADTSRQTDVGGAAPLLGGRADKGAFSKGIDQQQQQQQQTTTAAALSPAGGAAAPPFSSPLDIHPADADETLTRTAARPVEAVPSASGPPGAKLAAKLASAVPASILNRAPAAIAGPLAASAAQHVPGGGAAAVRGAVTSRTASTTWADCEPSVQDLVAATMAGAYAATIAGKHHPSGLKLDSAARAACCERAFSAAVTWDGPLTYLRGRERARVAPRLMSLWFESAVFVPRVVTLALVGTGLAAGLGLGPGAGAGAGGGYEGGATSAASGAAPMPQGLGRIDVEGTLFLMVRESLRRAVPFGLLPIDVPVSGVWSIVARPQDDKVLSLTDRPANVFKAPRLLRAIVGTVATTTALAFTRW